MRLAVEHFPHVLALSRSEARHRFRFKPSENLPRGTNRVTQCILPATQQRTAHKRAITTCAVGQWGVTLADGNYGVPSRQAPVSPPLPVVLYSLLGLASVRCMGAETVRPLTWTTTADPAVDTEVGRGCGHRGVGRPRTQPLSQYASTPSDLPGAGRASLARTRMAFFTILTWTASCLPQQRRCPGPRHRKGAAHGHRQACKGARCGRAIRIDHEVLLAQALVTSTPSGHADSHVPNPTSRNLS